MRFSISHKILVIFSLLSLLTIILGTILFYGNTDFVTNNERIKTINELKILLTKLGQFHNIAASNHENFPYEQYITTLDSTEQVIDTIINTEKTTVANKDTESFIHVQKQLTYFSKAANELFEKLQYEKQLFTENASIIQKFIRNEEKISRNNELQLYYNLLILENIWDDIYSKHDLSKIPLLKKVKSQMSAETGTEEFISQIDRFINNSEQFYINHLAIKNKKEFLDDSEHRFIEIANRSIHTITNRIETNQNLLKHLIISLVLFSILLTFILWFLVSRYLKTFLNHVDLAIKSIREGEYDFDIQTIPEDEFGDVLLLLEHLSQSLKEEIIARRRSEKEKHNLQKQLNHAQRIESIGRLAGGVAHDFNNILTSITGYSELALLKTDKDNPLHQYCTTINESAQKAAALTKQLLAFSRKQILEKQVVDINTIVDNVAKMLKRIIGEDIILEIRIKNSIHNILVDVNQIEQVLMNLAVNARDAMPNGGRLIIETDEVDLNAEYVKYHDNVKAGTYAMLCVSDNGLGMSQEIVEQIFDPFFTTKEVGKGTGLGLATVYGTVKQHHGHIWVYSEPDHGTTFKIYLPIAESKMEQPNKLPAVPLSKGKETLLIVDDDHSVRKLIFDCLSPLGYTILESSNGEEALIICKEEIKKIDLMLTDVIMPKMNGHELSLAIRNIRPEMKILYMSGYADNLLESDEVVNHAKLKFIAKPITPSVLTRKIREILDAN